MSQEDLARAVGTSTDSLIAYEKDRRPIPSDVLRRICETLKLSADWLFWGRSQATPP